MAAMASQTQLSATGNGNSICQNGAVTIIQATFPISSATATCSVGDLLDTDIITVHPTQAVASHTVPYVEIKASRTNTAQGVVTIGTQDGSTSPASTMVLRIIKWRV